MKFKLFPPTGHKIFFSDLFNHNSAFLPEGFPTNSGTTALYFLLSALNIPRGSKIIIPAYSCPTVAAAVLRAGHTPYLSDVTPKNLSYETSALTKKIGDPGAKAVVWVNLFGLETPIPDLDIPVVLDNAQCLSCPNNIQNVAGAIYSFGRGKPVNSLNGGLAVVTTPEYFVNVEQKYKSLPEIHIFQELKYLVTIFAYKLFFNPFRYAIPANLSFLKLGETVFKSDFPISKMLPRNKIVVQNIMSRLEKTEENRKKICQGYREILLEFKDSLHIYKKDVFYRFPVLLKSIDLKHKLRKSLKTIGISSTILYPTPLNEQPGLAEILNDNQVYPGAKHISENLITLPVNEFITENVLKKIQKVFKNILS